MQTITVNSNNDKFSQLSIRFEYDEQSKNQIMAFLCNGVEIRIPLDQNYSIKRDMLKITEQPSVMAAPPVVDLRQLNAAQTVWPVVGGSELITHTAPYFESHAYQQVYKKGKKREIYIAGCSGLRDLSKQLKIPIFKVGECGTGRIKIRINELSRDQYGSGWYDNDKFMLDQGYAKYASTTIELQNAPHENSPVQATARGLVVTLPHSMDERTFSTAFLAKMQSCSFLYWLETEDGTKHLETQGVKCDKARRFTSYRHGTTHDDKPATEL